MFGPRFVEFLFSIREAECIKIIVVRLAYNFINIRLTTAKAKQMFPEGAVVKCFVI